jgi:P-type Ca2+ transporter type 2C
LADFNRTVAKSSDRGLRLIAVAKAEFSSRKLPTSQHDFKFKLLGLIEFADPVRPGVAQSVSECYSAGIQVKMITGDYPGTATFIARQIGLQNPDQVLTGSEISQLSNEQLALRIKSVNVFARIVPEQKLKIVEALKNNGEIVAMTGDGVNDAPALKSAHIGIAMGERGTDVARESADLVLLDDDFSSIVSAVSLGRRIFDNLKKAVSYIFAVHVPVAGISLVPVLFGLPVVLFPAHIAFLELIIDPSSSVVFETEPGEANIMQHPPRPVTESLFARKNIFVGLFQGFFILISVLIVYFTALSLGWDSSRIRSLTFATLIFANLLLIITNLSRTDNLITVLSRKNKSLFIILFSTAFALISILYFPALRSLFHLARLSPSEIFISSWVGLVSILWFEILKFRKSV